MKLQEETPVLDHGFVALESHDASDLHVVNAARVSFNKRHEQMETGDDKLINYLLKHRHGTPFEHTFFRFRIKAPIFVFREWHRHRIGHSYNEWSARYSELKGEFYIPEGPNIRIQVGKPGAYKYEPAGRIDAAYLANGLEEHCKKAFQYYQNCLTFGIAKEQARFFLPVNIYSEMYWSCNARSLMHFLGLRNAEQAMWEIRQYALVVEEFFARTMPVTHEAFRTNGRVAP